MSDLFEELGNNFINIGEKEGIVRSKIWAIDYCANDRKFTREQMCGKTEEREQVFLRLMNKFSDHQRIDNSSFIVGEKETFTIPMSNEHDCLNYWKAKDLPNEFYNFGNYEQLYVTIDVNSSNRDVKIVVEGKIDITDKTKIPACVNAIISGLDGKFTVKSNITKTRKLTLKDSTGKREKHTVNYTTIILNKEYEESDGKLILDKAIANIIETAYNSIVNQ